MKGTTLNGGVCWCYTEELVSFVMFPQSPPSPLLPQPLVDLRCCLIAGEAVAFLDSGGRSGGMLPSWGAGMCGVGQRSQPSSPGYRSRRGAAPSRASRGNVRGSSGCAELPTSSCLGRLRLLPLISMGLAFVLSKGRYV